MPLNGRRVFATALVKINISGFTPDPQKPCVLAVPTSKALLCAFILFLIQNIARLPGRPIGLHFVA